MTRGVLVESIISITLQNGRAIRSDSIEFRERLPITAELLDRVMLAESSDNPGGAIWEAIGALITAVLAIEARGVQFDDEDPE